MKSKSKLKATNQKPVLKKIKTYKTITQYILNTNDLQVLYIHMPNTGIVTSNIVYKVGSRDESRGETGIAHMLEHMLFKPTKQDIERSVDSGAMQFEREVGVILNANTWKDRTNYFFSYPKSYYNRALQIEAERMRDVVLTDKEFLPERTNVLSEYDMYAGDEDFLLSVQMTGTALHSHPYGHETIGYREDIESYTTEKLKAFYEKYYVPNNATLIVVGDISEKEVKKAVLTYFAHLPASTTLQKRAHIVEPKQEGKRLVTIKRPSSRNILSFGVRHAGFPTKEWFETQVALEILAFGDDCILHKKLVDTGLASSIVAQIEPAYDANIGMLSINLTKKTSHEKMYTQVMSVLQSLTEKDIRPYLKKVIARNITSEFVTRSSSLGLTSELVEYVSADAWEHYFETEKILSDISVHDVLARIRVLFKEEQLTIGHFIGTK